MPANPEKPPPPQEPRRHSPARAGFTLAEVLTVLVLIGIMVSIAAPRLDISWYRMNSAVESAGSILFAAQRAAVTKQHNVVVAFQADAGLLRLHEDADNDGAIDPGERVRFEALEDGIVFGRGGVPPFRIGPDPVSFTRTQGGLPAVTFHRSGSASEEGGFYLTTRRAASGGASAAASRLVVVDRGTGRASWFHYSGSAWTRNF